jgi:hypothetical protein
MIAGIAYCLSGLYAGLISLFIGALLIFIGLASKDESARDNRPSAVLTDDGAPYRRRSPLKLWHNRGLAVSILCLVGLIFYGVVQRTNKFPAGHPEAKHANGSSENSPQGQAPPQVPLETQKNGIPSDKPPPSTKSIFR